MTEFNLNILGCGSATPTPYRNPTSQVLDFRGRLMMIDCGEGAQAMMRRMRLSFTRLSHIFISHMHGDHCLGLPGLLSTLALHDKRGEITVVMPKEGVGIMRQITDYFCRERSFELKFIGVEGSGGCVVDLPALSVEAFPLYHRVPAYGYLFREKPKLPHLLSDMLEFYQVPMSQRAQIKAGADFVTEDGAVIPNNRFTRPADRSVSYAFCSDTAFDERVAAAVTGVDVLYHEATYDSSFKKLAAERGHSTAAEAGRIAAMARAGALIIGHYSKRYNSVDVLVNEARSEFVNVIPAADGLKIDLYNPLK